MKPKILGKYLREGAVPVHNEELGLLSQLAGRGSDSKCKLLIMWASARPEWMGLVSIHVILKVTYSEKPRHTLRQL